MKYESTPLRKPSLEEIARALGGEMAGNQVRAPGPGHSPQDRSLSITASSSDPAGYVVHSFAGDDPITCKDHVREKLGMPAWQPSTGNGHDHDPVVASYVYRTANDKPYLRVQRGFEHKMSINPMHMAHAAPRCTARSKRTGKRCRAPAVRGWRVCRMHGARGGAPEGTRNGNYKHGARSKKTIVLWKLIKSLR